MTLKNEMSARALEMEELENVNGGGRFMTRLEGKSILANNS